MLDFLEALKRLRSLTEELGQLEAIGESPDGKVRLVLSGHFEMRKIEIAHPIAPSELEEAMKSAYEKARQKLQALILEKVGGGWPGGLPFLPGGFGVS